MKTRQDKPWQEAPGAADLPLGPQDIGALIARMQPQTDGAENFLKVAAELHGLQALATELAEYGPR